MRYKITVEYRGTDFCGWQIQKNAPSIQQTLENALSELVGAPVAVTGSGRTDTGVHALGQVAHFDACTSIPCDKIPFAVNTKLPQSIRVTSCKIVDDKFHARYGAKRKTYVYKMYFSPHSRPVNDNLALHVPIKPDVEKMKRAAQDIVGTHDFTAFSATGGKVKSFVRTVYSVEITESGDSLQIEVCGNGFLYNMVRIIAGTLLYVGQGKIAEDEISDILESKDRTRAGKTLPPYGLYLKSVEYK